MDVAIGLLDKYGPFVAIGIIVTLALVPVIRDKLIPSLIQEMIERRNFQRQLEVDRLASAKRTEDSIRIMSEAMIQTNDRIAVILQNQTVIQERENDILEVLRDGITAMRERVASREGYERGKKEHKTGDTGPLEGKP